MAAIKKHLLTFALLVLLQRQAAATLNTDLVLNFFHQAGGNGRQVYDGLGDQSLTLYEPVLFINSQIDYDTSLGGSLVFDALSSASAKSFDSATGASKKAGGGTPILPGWQTRVGGDAVYSKKKGSWVFAPSAGFSHELSYNSLHAGLNVQKFMAEDNFVLSAGVFHFSDAANQWNLVKDEFNGFKPKTTNSANASATQILDEKSIILGGISFTRQAGFLEGTRNTVSTGTVTDRVSEVLPGARDKWTANARYVRSLRPDLALHLDYRYYTDSWNIRSHTWEPSLAWSFADEAGALRGYYRHYSQTAAKYYADSFPAPKSYMTSDSDLAKLTANEAGLQLTYSPEPENADARAWTYGGAVIYYKRSDGLAAAVLQATLSTKF